MTVLIIKLFIFLFFLALNAFFSGAETAITSLTNSHIRRAKEKYNKIYKYISYWEKNPDDVITTLLVWMNMSVVAVGVMAASITLDIIASYNLDKAVWLTILSVLSIIITLIFANILPKTICRYKAEQYAVKALPVIVNLTSITTHLNSFLVSISNGLLNFFGRKTSEPQSMGADEVDFLLSNENVSPLSLGSRKIINRIIEFRKTKITQVMVARSEIFAVNLDQPKDKIIEQIIATQYSRVPVYKGTMNNIIGILNVKDIAATWRNENLFTIEDILRPVYYVPETAYTKQLLVNFKTGRHHMAIVVDEFGSTIGLVTIEDLLEEIIGEVWDEYDVKEKNVIKLEENEYLINASESIANVNDELKINIPEDHFSTINGWVLECFGYIPKVCEKVSWENFEIEIESVDIKKIKRIILRIKQNVL
jgi:CBS domain containing-hemolysin-like protein